MYILVYIHIFLKCFIILNVIIVTRNIQVGLKDLVTVYSNTEIPTV